MSKQLHINYSFPIGDCLRLSEQVQTEAGNTYFRLPFWIQKQEGDLIIHEQMPDDLSQFIVKARLGGKNPQPIKPNL